MKNYHLLGMKGIRDCNNRKIQLEYYIVEINNELAGPVYGIRIIKHLKEQQITEKEESWGISKDRSEVERLALTFMENEVMPVTLIELADEYVTLKTAERSRAAICAY